MSPEKRLAPVLKYILLVPWLKNHAPDPASATCAPFQSALIAHRSMENPEEEVTLLERGDMALAPLEGISKYPLGAHRPTEI
jgi:hypothetical protein